MAVQQLSYDRVGRPASSNTGAFTEAYTYNVCGTMMCDGDDGMTTDANEEITLSCDADPINLSDPRGLQPVYNTEGEFIGCTSEGFTGEILIYGGEGEIKPEEFTAESLQDTYTIYSYDDVLQGKNDAPQMSNKAHSNLLTNFARHFEGTQIYDETFSLETVKDQKIFFGRNKDGGWGTYIPSRRIKCYGNFTYEATVENFASTMLVHEWYSHAMKGCSDDYKSHRLAYKNVINYKAFWNATTNKYKGFVMKELQDYTYKEINLQMVEPLYRRLYFNYIKYCNSQKKTQ